MVPQSTLSQLRRIVAQWPSTPQEQKEAAKRFIGLLQGQAKEAAGVEDTDPLDASEEFLKKPPEDLLENLSRNLPPPSFLSRMQQQSPGSLDPFFPFSTRRVPEVRGFIDQRGSLLGGLWHVLNYFTYYKMKMRAGVIGRTGLFEVIKELGEDSGQVRLHLVGHSMGAIVCTLACKKLVEAGSDFKPSSLTLLQGAFTHYGFGKDVNVKGITDGPYRVIVEKDAVAGPIAVTFSENDDALHVLYAIAQRLAGDIVRPLFIGDKNDPYGAIGANGSQKTPEAEEIALDTSPKVYPFAKGSVYSLNGKRAIQNHGDVRNEAIAAALLSAAESR